MSYKFRITIDFLHNVGIAEAIISHSVCVCVGGGGGGGKCNVAKFKLRAVHSETTI